MRKRKVGQLPKSVVDIGRPHSFYFQKEDGKEKLKLVLTEEDPLVPKGLGHSSTE
jgi:hypothetical protein